MYVNETRVRVRYAETDQMGVVYYSNYLVWMEVGRVEYCKGAGFNYRDMEIEDEVVLAVVEANCRYLHPAKFDDEIAVRTWISAATPRMVAFSYEMRNAATDRVLATGETKHVFCGRDMRATKLPAKYHSRFGITRTAALKQPSF